MSYTIIKVIITSLLIVAISELSKRSSLFGALLASLPLISVLAILWIPKMWGKRLHHAG
jgi:hypothetical protein